ncbi:hypothetical protein GCM10023177_39500 [Streptomyces violaceoruber]|nr:hypothetical protein JCM4020_51120 [Streptomyces coelicolor]
MEHASNSAMSSIPCGSDTRYFSHQPRRPAAAMLTRASTYSASAQSQLQARVRTRSGLTARTPDSMCEIVPRSTPSSLAADSADVPADVRAGAREGISRKNGHVAGRYEGH